MSRRLLATLLVLVFAAGRSSAATCADGSSPGTNGCCAATNECPPCCIYAAVSNYGDSAECRCLFCDGATAKIDAACTSPPPPAGEVAVRSSCPAEYPTYAGGGIGANVCEYCYNDGTLTWEEQAAMINGYLPRPPPRRRRDNILVWHPRLAFASLIRQPSLAATPWLPCMVGATRSPPAV